MIETIPLSEIIKKSNKKLVKNDKSRNRRIFRSRAKLF